MSERYRVVAGRIRQELMELERVVDRAERAVTAAKRRPEDQDLYLDSAALNLHDFYAGLERLFQQIAAVVDRSVPTGYEWHRDLLRQMSMALTPVRPQVLSTKTSKALDEYLRFRHVVRNIYAFEFDPERIERLVQQLQPAFEQLQAELLAFADFLTKLAEAIHQEQPDD
jgi:hypothetical protein